MMLKAMIPCVPSSDPQRQEPQFISASNYAGAQQPTYAGLRGIGSVVGCCGSRAEARLFQRGKLKVLNRR